MISAEPTASNLPTQLGSLSAQAKPLAFENRFSQRARAIQSSAIREILKVTERPDVISFAGGSCSVEDDDAVRWFGPSPAKWAAALGINDHQLARRHVLAAIRELFEETGVLLAGPDELSLVEDTSGEEWMRKRLALASAELTFAQLLERRGERQAAHAHVSSHLQQRRRLARLQGLENGEQEILIDRAEHTPHLLLLDLAGTVGDGLIEQRQRVAHATRRRTCNQG